MAVCIYHKNCNDGTLAAAVVLSKYPDAKLFAFNYSYTEDALFSVLNAVEKEEVVYIVDFSFKKEDDYQKLLEKAVKVVNLDHHIGAKETLESIVQKYENFEFVFDNEKSGARLAWEYFYESEAPEIIKYVEDRDLWRWKYGNKTKYVNAYLFTFVDRPEVVKDLLNQEVSDIIEKGKLISEYNDFLINKFLERAKAINLKIGDYVVKAYNVCLFQSEIGDELSTREEQAVALFTIIGDNVVISFRSKNHHNPSALELAKMLGGGGHKNAAGATMKLSEFVVLLSPFF